MENLKTSKSLPFSKSDQVFFRLFNNSKTITEKKLTPPIFKVIKRQETFSQKGILSENLDILDLKTINKKLYITVTNIEKFVGEEYAIKYLNGYLEYNKLTLSNLINNN